MYIFVQVVFMLMKKGWNYKQPIELRPRGVCGAGVPGPMKGRAQPPSDPLPIAPRGEIVVPPPPLPAIRSSPFAVTPPKPAAV